MNERDDNMNSLLFGEALLLFWEALKLLRKALRLLLLFGEFSAWGSFKIVTGRL